MSNLYNFAMLATTTKHIERKIMLSIATFLITLLCNFSISCAMENLEEMETKITSKVASLKNLSMTVIIEEIRKEMVNNTPLNIISDKYLRKLPTDLSQIMGQRLATPAISYLNMLAKDGVYLSKSDWKEIAYLMSWSPNGKTMIFAFHNKKVFLYDSSDDPLSYEGCKKIVQLPVGQIIIPQPNPRRTYSSTCVNNFVNLHMSNHKISSEKSKLCGYTNKLITSFSWSYDGQYVTAHHDDESITRWPITLSQTLSRSNHLLNKNVTLWDSTNTKLPNITANQCLLLTYAYEHDLILCGHCDKFNKNIYNEFSEAEKKFMQPLIYHKGCMPYNATLYSLTYLLALVGTLQLFHYFK